MVNIRKFNPWNRCRGIEALEEMVDNGGYKVAFAMYPTDIESLMKVADANKVMPP